MKNSLLTLLVALGVSAIAGVAQAQTATDRGGGIYFPERGMERTPPASGKSDDQGACSGRIMGGECATPGAWPWQVALYKMVDKDKASFFCGGSVIAPRWILTAAHCVANQGQLMAAQDLFVLEGTHHIGQNGGGHFIKVAQIIPHERWNHNTMENDIALVNLQEDATSAPVSTATTADGAMEKGGNSTTVTGWGNLKPFYIKKDQAGTVHYYDGGTNQEVTTDELKKYFTTDLMQVTLPLVETPQCNQGYSDISTHGVIDQRTLCAGIPEGGKDSCQGDSGGPLVGQNSENQWVQLGVVSWGASCGMKGHAGIYTRVSMFQPWLKAKTGIDQSSSTTDTQNVVQNETGLPNPANLQVAFVQGANVRMGQTIQIAVTAQRPGYLVLFDQTPDGKLTQIYPSELSVRSPLGSQIRPMEAGKVLMFPDPKNPYAGYTFTASPPAGQGKLVAVLLDKLPKEMNVPQNPKTFTTRRQVLSYLDFVVKTINRDAQAGGVDPNTSVAVFDYNITQ